MSIANRIAFGVGASWFSRGLNIILGLVMMPVLFSKLDKEELGVWLLLGQTWMIVGMLDLGFTPTITRRIALAKGKSGSDTTGELSEESKREIADILASGKVLYTYLSIGAFVVAFISGWYFLDQMALSSLPVSVACIAWGILCVSQAVGVWASLWICLLQGVGYVGWESILSSFVGVLILIFQILFVSFGGGLIELATVAAVGAVVQRITILKFAKRRRPELFNTRGICNPGIIRAMLSPALRSWLTTVGTVLVVSTDQLFIAGINGITELPAYRAAFLLLFNLNALATTSAAASAVFISHLWQENNTKAIDRIIFRNLHLGLGMMAAGGACILALSRKLFDCWLGAGHFIGQPCLVVFFILFFLNTQAFILSNASRATEDEAFSISSLSSGILKLVLAYSLAAKFGLVGLALSSLLAQMLTNHWYMVYRALDRFSIPLLMYARSILVPVTLLFSLVYVLSAKIIVAGNKWGDIQLIITAGSLSCILLAIYIFVFAVSHSQRKRIFPWLFLNKNTKAI